MTPAYVLAVLALAATCAAAAAARAPSNPKAVVAAQCFLRADGTVANMKLKLAASSAGNGTYRWLCPPSAADLTRAPAADFCFRSNPVVGVVARNGAGGELGLVAFRRADGSAATCGRVADGTRLERAARKGRQLSGLSAACRSRGGVGGIAGAAFVAPLKPARLPVAAAADPQGWWDDCVDWLADVPCKIGLDCSNDPVRIICHDDPWDSNKSTFPCP
jgi:hypothetical protein